MTDSAGNSRTIKAVAAPGELRYLSPMSLAEILDELPKLTAEERDRVSLRILELQDESVADELGSAELLEAIDAARRDPRPSLSLDEMKSRFL